MTDAGFSRAEFKFIKNEKSWIFTCPIQDKTANDTSVERVIEYAALLDTCDREKDYEAAWKFVFQIF
jgi:hypothetical protein